MESERAARDDNRQPLAHGSKRPNRMNSRLLSLEFEPIRGLNAQAIDLAVRERNWRFTLMGQWGSHNTPTLDLPEFQPPGACKALLLAEEAKITDPTILSQLP